MGNNIIGMTGNPFSYLAQESNYVLSVAIQKEACPNNLAPTTSTTPNLLWETQLQFVCLKCEGLTKIILPNFTWQLTWQSIVLKSKTLVDRKNIPAVRPNSSLSDVIIEIGEKLVGRNSCIGK